MKVTVLQENLIKSLSYLTSFVSTKPQLPILANILLSANKGKFKLSATNLEIGISHSLGAKIDQEGAITIPARTITDLISNTQPGKITLESKNLKLHLIGNNLKAEINGIGAEEFPNIPETLPRSEIILKKEDIEQINRQVSFATSIDITRPTLTGILLIIDKNIKIIATDGFRLSFKEIPGSEKYETDSQQIIIPVRTLIETGKIYTQDTIWVFINKKEGQVLIGDDQTVLTSKIISGEFPNFERIIPKRNNSKFTAGKEELLKGVKATSVFARESANVVKMRIKSQELELYAESPEYGKNQITLEAKTEGEETEIAFNYKFLLDFLNSTNSDVVSLETEGPTSPAMFKDTKDNSYFHLIMPVRIQGSERAEGS